MDADVLALRRTRADVPDHVVESIRHALQPEPTARHTTAAAMAASLTTDASPAPVVAPTAAVPAATAAVAPTSVVPPVAPAFGGRDRGTAVLMVTHDLLSAADVADRIAFLEAGRVRHEVLAEGPDRFDVRALHARFQAGEAQAAA